MERQRSYVLGGSALGLVVINLVLSFTISGISIGGHIGGLIGGILCALILSEFGRGHAAYSRVGLWGIAGHPRRRPAQHRRRVPQGPRLRHVGVRMLRRGRVPPRPARLRPAVRGQLARGLARVPRAHAGPPLDPPVLARAGRAGADRERDPRRGDGALRSAPAAVDVRRRLRPRDEAAAARGRGGGGARLLRPARDSGVEGGDRADRHRLGQDPHHGRALRDRRLRAGLAAR